MIKKSKKMESMRIKPGWVQGLGELVCKWEFDEVTYFISKLLSAKLEVWTRLYSLRLSFLQKTLSQSSPKIKDGKCLVEGPNLIKTGSMPGRNCKIEKGSDQWSRLSKHTLTSQVMDDWFQDFKDTTHSWVSDIFQDKVCKYLLD